jgi:hypothetical protein
MSSPKQRMIKEKVVKIYPDAKLRRKYGIYYRVFRSPMLDSWMEEPGLLTFCTPIDGWFRSSDKAWEYAWKEIQTDLIERFAY